MQGILFLALKIYFHLDRATIDDLVSQGNCMIGFDIRVCYDSLHSFNMIDVFPIECKGSGTM